MRFLCINKLINLLVFETISLYFKYNQLGTQHYVLRESCYKWIKLFQLIGVDIFWRYPLDYL